MHTFMALQNNPIILQAVSLRNCVLCGITCKQDLCIACRDNLPQIPNNHCPTCLLPVATSLTCGTCLKKPPAFTRAIAALQYSFPVDALIHTLKYQSNLAIAPILANLLLEKTNKLKKPDFIIPMPLHPTKLKERGFNQALEIARCLSSHNNITLLPDTCKRVKNTAAQTRLPWKDRQKNIQDAFSCKMDFSSKHVAIVDDVMTTGATLNEISKILRKCGAEEVNGWVIARALPELNKTTINTHF